MPESDLAKQCTIIEPCAIARGGLLMLLADDAQLCYGYVTVSEAITDAQLLNAQAALIGPSHEPSAALKMARDIVAMAQAADIAPPKIVIFSHCANDVLFQADAAYSGVTACIVVPVQTQAALLQTVQDVLAGRHVINPHLRASTERLQHLSTRESDVLRLMADYRSNKEIAAALHTSLATVDKQVRNILAKLNVSNRGDAIRRAKQLGRV